MSSTGNMHILCRKKKLSVFVYSVLLLNRNNFAHHKSVGVKLFAYRIEASVNFSA